MTTAELQVAFEMRYDGMSFEEIGARFKCTGEEAEHSLKAVLAKQPRKPKIIYPRLAAFVEDQYGGSIQRWAETEGWSTPHLRDVLSHGKTPTKLVADRMAASAGMTVRKAFSTKKAAHKDYERSRRAKKKSKGAE